MQPLLALAALLAAANAAAPAPPAPVPAPPPPAKAPAPAPPPPAPAQRPLTPFKNLVTFGDSYTDVVITGDGGVSWPIYAAGYGHLNLFPFARAGATCSNNITFRPFPPLMESQVPLFSQELQNHTLPKLKAEETIYTLWIGTNDVGVSALLTDPKPGLSIVDTVSCAVDWVRVMYGLGARNFLFQNMIPLEHTILYAPNSYPNRYWALPRNTTQWALQIEEETRAGNALAALMLPQLPRELPGAKIGLFDSHALFTDMLARPQVYLNGTAPLNITGCINACVFQEGGTLDTADCTPQPQGSDRDSFLWFDELHPSEQADRVVARQIVNALQGNRTWTKWFT